MRIHFFLAWLTCLCLGVSARADLHSGLDTILKTHVDERGLVDYAALRADAAALDAYLGRLATIDLASLGRDEQLATLINAYNAFTLRLIADHYPIHSIRDIPEADRWKAVRWTLAGKQVSLDHIEHEMIRPVFGEPRIHFALVCAAVSCPPLRREAYRGDRIEKQLDDQMRQTHGINTPWTQFDATNNLLRVTSLYDWFAGDFKPQSPTTQAYVARYVPELKSTIDAGGAIKVDFLPYDWQLNDRQ
jgi:hypothetical protein